MKTYWDFTDRERAAMTEEDGTRLLDFELMHKGVFKPTPLQLQPEQPFELQRRQLYRVEFDHGMKVDIAFETHDQAQAFLKLSPQLILTSWHTGSNIESTKPIENAVVCIQMLTSETEVQAHTAELKRASAAKDANEKERRRFSDEASKVEKATHGVWDDWHAQRRLAIEMKKIDDTRAEYVQLCSGDDELADTFLAKTFGTPKLEAWNEWNGRALKATTPETAPEPKKTPEQPPMVGDEVPF